MAISMGAALLGAAGLSAATGLYGASQAGKAAQAGVSAAERSAQLSREQYQQTREDLAPWRTVGEQALYQYADVLGIPAPGADAAAAPDFSAFYESPGYQFQLAQGQKSIERSQAARGLLRSGQTLKAITEYGQGVAAQGYEGYMAKLGNLAGLGQQTATQLGQFGAGAAAQEGGAIESAGRARASGYLGQGAAVQGVASDIAGLGGYYTGYTQNQELLDRLEY